MPVSFFIENILIGIAESVFIITEITRSKNFFPVVFSFQNIDGIAVTVKKAFYNRKNKIITIIWVVFD